MNINILSQDKKTLVNYRNVAEILIDSKYKDFDSKELQWEIVVCYSAATSHRALKDVLGRYETEERCQKAFDILIDEIINGNNFIAM
jgi:hypothetical protein